MDLNVLILVITSASLGAAFMSLVDNSRAYERGRDETERRWARRFHAWPRERDDA